MFVRIAGTACSATPLARTRASGPVGCTKEAPGRTPAWEGMTMVILGLVLLIIGLVASIPILTTIGAILLVVGLILNLVPVGGTRRRVY